MNAEQFSTLITAVSGLIGVLIWPAILVFLIVLFRAPLGRFLGNLSEITFETAGVKAKLTKQTEAAALLGAAVQRWRKDDGEPEGDTEATVANVVRRATEKDAGKRMEAAHVLWIDDTPRNNILERQALEALGIKVSMGISTEDALEEVRVRSFDLIISDMSRPPDDRAGYTLLDALRQRNDHTPFIIYASSRQAEHQIEARQHGAMGTTNRPSELVEMVLTALDRKR